MTSHMGGVINPAGQAAGRNRTGFVIEAARREAVLLDRWLFSLSDEAFNAFTAAPDKPPQKIAKLKRLLETPELWDR